MTTGLSCIGFFFLLLLVVVVSVATSEAWRTSGGAPGYKTEEKRLMGVTHILVTVYNFDGSSSR